MTLSTADFLVEVITLGQLGQGLEDVAADNWLRPFQIGRVDHKPERTVRPYDKDLLRAASAKIIRLVWTQVFEIAVLQHGDDDIVLGGTGADGFRELAAKWQRVIQDDCLEREIFVADTDTETVTGVQGASLTNGGAKIIRLVARQGMGHEFDFLALKARLIAAFQRVNRRSATKPGKSVLIFFNERSSRAGAADEKGRALGAAAPHLDFGVVQTVDDRVANFLQNDATLGEQTV